MSFNRFSQHARINDTYVSNTGLGFMRDPEVLAISGFGYPLVVETFALSGCLLSVFQMGKQEQGKYRLLLGGVEQAEQQTAKLKEEGRTLEGYDFHFQGACILCRETA